MVLGNRAGECASSANLAVHKPNILKILEGLKDVDVDEGETILLKAKVEGKPQKVKWLKNGNEITPSDHIQIVSFAITVTKAQIYHDIMLFSDDTTLCCLKSLTII